MDMYVPLWPEIHMINVQVMRVQRYDQCGELDSGADVKQGRVWLRLGLGRITGISGKLCRIIRLGIRQEKTDPAQPYSIYKYMYNV